MEQVAMSMIAVNVNKCNGIWIVLKLYILRCFYMCKCVLSEKEIII